MLKYGAASRKHTARFTVCRVKVTRTPSANGANSLDDILNEDATIKGADG